MQNGAQTRRRSTPAIAIAIAVAFALALAAALAPRGGERDTRAPHAEPAAPPPALPAPSASGAPAPALPPERGAAPAAPAPEAGDEDAEAEATERVRDEVERDPARAIALADEADRRFPHGRQADRRSLLRMRSLVNLGRIGAARDEATAFFRRHRDSPLGEDVWRLTGVHPPPLPDPE